jgi:tape measure domain-containing protein
MSASAATTYSRRVVQLIIQTQGMQQAATEANRSLSSIEKSINSVKTALYAFGVGRAVEIFRDIADSAIAMNNILSTLNKTTEQTGFLQANLAHIADGARSPVDNVTKLYVRLDAAMGKFGKSTSETLKVTEAVTKGLKLGGATAGETASAILQLSQAFASGRLQGDEFRAVLENAPVLAKELAKQLAAMGAIADDSLASLRKAASAGELGTPQLFEAFLRAGPEIQAQFQKLTPTLSEFFTILRNQALLSFDTLNQRFHILKLIGDAMTLLAEVALARYAIVGLLRFAAIIAELLVSFTTVAGALGAVVRLISGASGIILAAAVALGIYKATVDETGTAFEKMKKSFETWNIVDLQNKTEQLRKQWYDLVKQRDELLKQMPAAIPGNEGGFTGFAAEDVQAKVDKLNERIAKTSEELRAAAQAFKNAEDAARATGSAMAEAAEDSAAFTAKMYDLNRALGLARAEMDALNKGDMQRYEDLVNNEKAYSAYITAKKSIESAQKGVPLTAQQDADLQALMQTLQTTEDNVKKFHDNLDKLDRERTQREAENARKRKEIRDKEAKDNARQAENIMAFDMQVQDIRDTRFEAQQGIAGVGLDPQALEQMAVGIKNVRDWRILENSALEKNMRLTGQEVDYYKDLINLRNQDVATAKRQQEEYSKLQDAAKSQDPVLGTIERFNELQQALDEVGSKLNPEQLRAVNNEMADLKAHMEGIGAAADRLKGMDNPFAPLLEGVAKFQEASTAQDPTKQFELMAQGTLGTLGFITEQMKSLGIENFEFQKAVSMSTAAINAAVAITEVFKSVPYPASYALAGVIAGLTGAQIAVIQNQQPPARASGGAVSAGMPYNVGERGAEMYSDTGGRQIFIPSANGTISPNAGRGNVNIINTGAPVRVVSKTEKEDGGIDIVVASVKAVEDTFEKSLRTGQGKFAKSLQQNTGAGRRY